MGDELKEIFTKASEIVKDLPDSLKPKAFELAVEQLKRTRNNQVSAVNGSREIIMQDFFEKMSSFLQIEQEKIKAVYKIDKNALLTLIVPMDGKPSEIQRNITLLYLLGNKIGLEKEWVSTLDLIKRITAYGVKDKNLSRNLKIQKGILQSGTKHGKEYGLSPIGITMAKELLNNLIQQI
ncbi:MAG: hypothetical protein V1922_01350 [bacterium]